MSLNNFEIGKNLGKGSFGSVCIVKRKADSKIYAMKRVHIGNMQKKEKENALNEVRILASLMHQNIIGYKEAFFDNNSRSLNIVMEFADDGDIESKIQYNIKKRLKFRENTIWSILIQMIEGLRFLHNNNIIHRDLKSANIFLMKNGTVKIGDLNVSKVTGNGMAKTQTGTPYYASPEIWQDKGYDNKTDIWSIGCIIYEMAALRPPFKGTSLINLYQNIKKGVYPPISNKIYSNELSKIIAKLLVVDPKKRPSCDEILNMPIIQQKIKEIKNLEDEEKKNNNGKVNLMKTIKIPKVLKDINKALPKKKYKEEKNEMMMCDEFETKKAFFNIDKNQDVLENKPQPIINIVNKPIVNNNLINKDNNTSEHQMANIEKSNMKRPQSSKHSSNSSKKVVNNLIGNNKVINNSNNNKIKIPLNLNSNSNKKPLNYYAANKRPSSGRPSSNKSHNKHSGGGVKNKPNSRPVSAKISGAKKPLNGGGGAKKKVVIQKYNYPSKNKAKVPAGYKPKIGNKK